MFKITGTYHQEYIESRPSTTVTEVMENSTTWLEKEVTIYAIPVLLSDNSTIYQEHGKRADMTLSLDLRYKLVSETGEQEAGLLLIDHRNILLKRGVHLDPKMLTSAYRLGDTTYVVSGRIEKFSNSSKVYLKYMHSLHQGK